MKNKMYEDKSYTEHFGKLGHDLKILDKKSREIKANKLLSVINDYSIKCNKDLKNFNCLDIGCSSGLITNLYADAGS